MASVRSVALALLMALAPLSPSAARATPPDKATCLGAYQEGQVLSRRGELLAARERLTMCARAPCPSLLVPECVGWLAEVERRMPTLVVVLRTPEGVDVRDARVLVDGRVVSPTVDGRALEVDPGEHTIRAEPAGEHAAPVEARVVAADSEKGRIVTLTLPGARAEPVLRPTGSLAEPPRPSSPRSIPTGSWIAGGVAAAGLVSFGIFSVLGNRSYAALEHCRPSCSDGDVKSTRTLYAVGDLGLVGAVVALGVAAAFYLASPRAAPGPGVQAIRF